MSIQVNFRDSTASGCREPQQLALGAPAEGQGGASMYRWENLSTEPLPDGCESEVVQATLEMGAMVAREGVGERVRANGMLLVVGDRDRLMNDSVGSVGEYNSFAWLDISVFQFLNDGGARTQVPIRF